MGVVSSTVAGTIGLIALAAGGGAYAATSGRQVEKKKKSLAADVERGEAQQRDEMAKLGKLPEMAEQKAKDDILRKRRMQQRTGGKTILTSEYGPGAVGKSLLGE